MNRNEDLRDFLSDDETPTRPAPIECQVVDSVGANSRAGDNKIRDFNVTQLNFGYIIKVGCHSFAIESAEKLTKLIGEYLKNPEVTEVKWFNNKLEGLIK